MRIVLRASRFIILILIITVFLTSVQFASAQPGSTFASSTMLSKGEYIYIIPSSSDHYYRFEAKDGQTVTFDLTTESSDLNVFLYNDAQALLSSSSQSGVGTSENIRYLIQSAGFYYFRVENKYPIQDIYTLIFSIGAPGEDFEDALEILDGTYNYTINGLNDHFFKISVLRGQTITSYLSTPKSADLDLYLYDADRFLIGSSVRSTRGVSEAIQYSADIEGEYFLKVVSRENNPFTYALTVNTIRIESIAVGWGSPSTPIEVGAGELGASLYLVIRDSSSINISNLYAIAYPSNPFSDPLGGNTVTASYDTPVSPGGIATFIFKVNVDSSALVGNYDLPITLQYYSIAGNELTYRNPVNFTVSAHITGKSRIEITPSTEVLVPDTTTQIVLSFNNTGTAGLSDLEVTASAPSPLTIEGNDNVWSIGTIPTQSMKQITINIFAPKIATEKSYQLTLSLSYRNVVGTITTISRTISIRVDKVDTRNIELISSSQTFSVGEENNLKFGIANNGNENITDLRVSYTIPLPLVGISGDNYLELGDLPSGSISEGSVKIFIPKQALGSTFNIEFNIRYRNQYGTELNEIRSLGLAITKSEKEPVLTVATTTSTMTAGSAQTLRVVVENKGTYARSVEALVLAKSPILITGSDKYFLGDLNTGESKVFEILARAPIELPDTTTSVDILLSYITLEGQQKSETHVLGLLVVKQREITTSIEYGPHNLVAGQINNVDFFITNTGNETAKSIEITLTPIKPLAVVGETNTWFVEELEPGSRTHIVAPIYPPAINVGSTTSVTLSIMFLTTFGDAKTENHDIGFVVPSQTDSGVRFSVNTENYDVLAQQINEIKLRLKNEGEKIADKVTITLSLPPQLSIVGSDNTWYFAKLDSGKEVNLESTIFASETSLGATYQSTLMIEYKDSSGADKTETLAMGLTVRGFVDLKVSGIIIRPNPANPQEGLTISGIIYNGGIVQAKTVNITVLANKPFIKILGDTTIIGDIPKDGQSSFSVTTLLGKTEPGIYPLDILFVFKDDRNELQQTIINIPIEVGPEPQDELSQPERNTFLAIFDNPYFLGITAFALGVISTTMIARKRRRKDPEEQF